MKTLAVSFAIVSAVLFSGCVSSVERRITRNPQIFNGLDEQQKTLVRHGGIEEGMSRDAVFLAWGRPSRASRGTRSGKSIERWSYEGYDAVHTTAMGFGVGYGRYDYAGPWMADPLFYQAPVAAYVPYEARWVEFAGGKVVAWSADRWR